jgi:hypothetical protein
MVGVGLFVGLVGAGQAAGADETAAANETGTNMAPLVAPLPKSEASIGRLQMDATHEVEVSEPNNDATAFALTVWTTADGGAHWQQANLPLGATKWEDDGDATVRSPDGTHIFVANDEDIGMNHHNNAFWESSDGGKSFTLISNMPLADFSFTDATHGVGYTVIEPTEPGNQIVLTSDGGKTWTPVDLGHVSEIRDGTLPGPSSPNDGTISVQLDSGKQQTWATHDGGKSWKKDKKK